MISLSVVSSQQVSAMVRSSEVSPLPLGPARPEVQAVVTQPPQPAPVKKVESGELSNSTDRHLNYAYDKDIHRVVTKVVNDKKEVVLQIPPEQVVQMYKVLARLNSKSKVNIEV